MGTNLSADNTNSPQSSGAISSLGQALNFYNPVGPLSGKTTVAVLIWLVAWGFLHVMCKKKNVHLGKTELATLLLIALGLLGTFPLFFEIFTH